MKSFGSRKILNILFLISFGVFNFYSLTYADTEKLIKTQDKGFAESVPGLKQLEEFRMKSYDKCIVAQGEYDSQYSDKKTDTILDKTKRDLAYQATQGVLPDSLKQQDNDFGKTGIKDSHDLVKYHLNGICGKFLGSQFIFYGISVIILLIIIKIFHR